MSSEQICGLLVAVGLTVTLLLVWRTRRFLSRAARASGTISHVSVETRHYKGHGSDHPEETTMYYTPHVEFSSEDGSLLTFAGSERAGNSQYKQGDVVAVVYDRGKPGTTAQIEGPDVWWRVWLSGLATLALFVYTIVSKACP
jgi:Protein of unknown function (DUF3592)